MKEKLEIWLLDLVHNNSLRPNIIPLGIGYLASALQSTQGDKVNFKLFKSPDKFIDAFKKHQPDVIALSNYIWNHRLSLRIARLIKEKTPKVITVMGGPQIRTDKKGMYDFLQNHRYIDVYIPFEAETPFCSLIEQIIKKGKDINKLGNIKGCYLNVPNYDFRFVDIKKENHFNLYGSPYLKGILNEFLDNSLPLLETNRGCPYQCTFCAWGTVCTKLIKKSLKMCFDEFDYIANKCSKDFWYFTDGNFGLFKEDLKIASELKKINKKFGYPQHLYLHTGKNCVERLIEISDILKDMFASEIAVQSMDPEVLKNVKRTNLPNKDICRLMKVYHDNNRDVNTDVLLGLSGETSESHLTTLRTCFEMGFDFISANNLRMHPGTKMETDEYRNLYGVRTKYRLLDSGYGMYANEFVCEFDETIIATNTLTEKDIYWFKKIQFLICLLWNSKFTKSLLTLGLKFGVNPLDVMLELEKDKEISEKILTPLDKEHKKEWFNSEKEISEYYSKPKNFNKILNKKKSPKKLNLKYLAYCIGNKDVLRAIINNTSKIIQKSSNIDKNLLGVVTKMSLDRLRIDIQIKELNKIIKYKIKEKDFNILKKLKIIPSNILYEKDGFTISYIIKNKEFLEQSKSKKNLADAIYFAFILGMTSCFTYSIDTKGARNENHRKIKGRIKLNPRTKSMEE